MSVSRQELGDASRPVTRISSDTRSLQPGDLYLAIRGDNFDGHNFIPAAISAGACGAWVGNDWEYPDELPAGFAVLRAPEPLDALGAYQRLARAYRQKLMTPIIAVTGSNGKTSTKDLLACAFGSRLKVHKTHGNLNNHIGVPRTLLQLETDHDLAIVEMGMNNAGEISFLAGLASPQVGVITNIGVAHIGRLGSQEAIAREKGSLLEALSPDGLAVLPSKDDFTWFLQDLTSADVITGGIEDGHVSAHNLRAVSGGTEFQVRRASSGSPLRGFLPVPGEHMVANAMLALAAVEGFAPDMFAEALEALARVELTSGRLQVREVAGLRIIDDTYNANPDSMVAGLRTLQRMCAAAGMHSRGIAVLGAMGELGPFEDEGYEKVARAAGDLAIEAIIAVGVTNPAMERAARDAGIPQFIAASDHQTAAAALREIATPGDFVLLKGSRSSHMERVLTALGADSAPGH